MSPSLHTNPPPLHLPWVVLPREHASHTLHIPYLQTWTNMVIQTHSIYYIFIFQWTHCLPQVLYLQFSSQVTVFPHRCPIFPLHLLPCILPHSGQSFPTATTMPPQLGLGPHSISRKNFDLLATLKEASDITPLTLLYFIPRHNLLQLNKDIQLSILIINSSCLTLTDTYR